MKKTGIICLILCLAVLLTAQPVTAASGADASVSAGCHSVDAAKCLSSEGKLLDTSKAVILYELNSDTMVYSYNPDVTIYPSSMVKIMTALVALEKGTLSDTVTVTRSALDNVAIGSVSAGLKRGEEISLEALLYCMMTASANDAASVIAEHIGGGSIDSFIQMMNDKAREIGCLSTNYTNVHGLHDEQTYTTARDICRLMEVALENEQFVKLFTADTYTVPLTNKSGERVLKSTNNMMIKGTKHYDARVTGGKTGSTNQAGRCLAVTAEANGMNLLGIVMGAVPTYEEEGIILKYYGNFEEMKALLDYGCGEFEYRQVFYDNQALTQYPVSGGANHVVAKPVSELSTVLPIGIDETKLKWVYDKVGQTITAPVEQGQTIATAQVWYGETCLVQTELVAMNAVDVYVAPVIPDIPERESIDFTILFVILGVVLGIFVLFFGVLLILRWINRAKMRARQRRRRQNRRRMR